jgi:hypothetical protein
MRRHDKGNHPCLNEEWLIDNLPEGWEYDCYMGEQFGFIITAPDGKSLFIPLELLTTERRKLHEIQGARRTRS